jgi:hypothetical protein
MDHIDFLQNRLANERERLRLARTDGERAIRTVWINQIEREIAEETGFDLSRR